MELLPAVRRCLGLAAPASSYTIFFVAQFVLFLLIPQLAASGNWMVFQVSLFIVFTMHGDGFATIPAFLADIFDPENVGAFHGALPTAWSAAAVAGPVRPSIDHKSCQKPAEFLPHAGDSAARALYLHAHDRALGAHPICDSEVRSCQHWAAPRPTNQH